MAPGSGRYDLQSARSRGTSDESNKVPLFFGNLSPRTSSIGDEGGKGSGVVTIYERGRQADILLIDDNPGDVKLIEIAFRKIQLPTQTTVAGTAEQGLKMLHKNNGDNERHQPDIVLLDLNLPSMHGLRFLELVKTDPALTSIPVLVLSSSSAQKDIADSYNRHANGYVTKPSTFEGYLAFVGCISEYWFKILQTPQGFSKIN
jgi:CheY-like chemotaxis protein